MADRRAVRSSSRRITPTPQPPSKLNTPQTGRTTRKRGTRSASRDVELPPEDKKPTRRSARQASEASAAGENENAVEARPKTTRKAYKEPVAGRSSLHPIALGLAHGDPRTISFQLLTFDCDRPFDCRRSRYTAPSRKRSIHASAT